MKISYTQLFHHNHSISHSFFPIIGKTFKNRYNGLPLKLLATAESMEHVTFKWNVLPE